MRGYSDEHLLNIYFYCKKYGETVVTGKYMYRVFQTGENTFELHRKPVKNNGKHASECILKIDEVKSPA